MVSFLSTYSLVFKQRMDMHQYNMRNKTALNVARAKTKLAEYSLKNITPRLLMTDQKL